MKTFNIEVQEILSRVISIEAVSHNEAILKVKEMYSNQEIVLDAEDYRDTEITIFINDSQIQEIIKNNFGDERIILEKILCHIGISETQSNLIAIEVGSSQCIVNEDYLIEVGIPSFNINNAMKYVNKFYRGEFSPI